MKGSCGVEKPWLMSTRYCPKCRQSFFDPGQTKQIFVCIDGTIHPSVVIEKNGEETKQFVFKKMR